MWQRANQPSTAHQNSISSSMIPSIALRETGNLRIKQFALPLLVSTPKLIHSLEKLNKQRNHLHNIRAPQSPKPSSTSLYSLPPPKSRPPLDSSSTSHPRTLSLSSSPNQPPHNTFLLPCIHTSPHLPKDSKHLIISLLPPDPIRPSPYPIPQKRFPCLEI